MDPDKKRTLDLVEEAVAHVGVAERGRQLIHVVRDYVEDGDALYARTVLARIDPEYFEDHMYRQAAEDAAFAAVVADLIDALGLGFVVLGRPVRGQA